MKNEKVITPMNKNAMKGGGYSLIITVVVLAIMIVVNYFASALPANWTKLDMSSSQLYSIVHTSDYTSSLDGLYACFGYVIEGMDIVDAICSAADPDAENGMIEAEDQPVITSITIREVE